MYDAKYQVDKVVGSTAVMLFMIFSLFILYSLSSLEVGEIESHTLTRGEHGHRMDDPERWAKYRAYIKEDVIEEQ